MQEAARLSSERRAALRNLNAARPGINRIMSGILPDHGLITGTSLSSHQDALKHVRRAHACLLGMGVVDYVVELFDEHIPALPFTSSTPWSMYQRRPIVDAVDARAVRRAVRLAQVPIQDGA